MSVVTSGMAVKLLVAAFVPIGGFEWRSGREGSLVTGWGDPKLIGIFGSELDGPMARILSEGEDDLGKLDDARGEASRAARGEKLCIKAAMCCPIVLGAGLVGDVCVSSPLLVVSVGGTPN